MIKNSGTVAAVITMLSVFVSYAAHAEADFEGIWTPNIQPGSGGPRPDSEISLTPAGQAELDAYRTEDDPVFRCVMPGLPKGFVDPYPIEIIQQAHQIVFLYEYFHLGKLSFPARTSLVVQGSTTPF